MFERVETPRLILRRPVPSDAEAIFARYGCDREVARLLGWPRHTSLDQTHGFLEFSDAELARWPAGPYLVESRHDGTLLGSTGLGFETSERAMTGYVFARDAWGKGYATECLRAEVNIARDLGVVRVYALCHTENPASWCVLEKCGFVCEGVWPKHTRFPNLSQEELCDVLCYACIAPVLTSYP
jgi:[ribosomal protein S5]-alanine N-acetyltransferase